MKYIEKGGDTAAVENRMDLSNIKIGYCTPSLNAPFYVVLTQYVQKYTEGYGMKFVSADGQDDIIKQITSLEDLIATGINVLILNPLDHKALVPAVNAAVKSGVPVFIVDSAIDPTANYITLAGFDGQKEAYELIKEGKFGATALNSPQELARLVVEAVVKYLNGERQINKIIYTNPVLITKDNVDKYYDPKALF